MPMPSRDDDREHRIAMEIVVDAYGPEEQALGWYYYLQEQLQFPFTATCRTQRMISPLEVGDEVEVLDMAPETECAHEMFVVIRWQRHGLAVPLAQLDGSGTAEQTQQAIDDWQYWIQQGHQL